MHLSATSKSPSLSRAYGASTKLNAVQQAASGAYTSVAQPTKYEDYDLYEMHHCPSQNTHFSYYNSSYDPSVNDGETGSVI